MQHYQNNITDQKGNAISGASVLIKTPAGAVATLYSDNGVTQIINPATTDANGTFNFYAANGTYTVSVTSAGTTSATSLSPITLFDIADAGLATSTNLAASGGSGLIGWIQAGAAAVFRWVQDKLRETLSITDFYANGVSGPAVDPTGVLDSTAGMQAARDYLASFGSSRKPRLIFPAGLYKYSVSPNWAIQNAVIQAEGEVRLRYTGTGNCVIFDAGTTGNIYNTTFRGRFVVEGLSTSLHGVYVRGVHHSHIEARVSGCGSTSAALRTEFAVCTVFDVRATANEEAWFARPLTGYSLTQRGAGETTSDCTFPNPIIEGVAGDGIVCDFAVKNKFIAGTSEGNVGLGVYCTANSALNCFDAIDLEANTGGGLRVAGRSNSFIDILNTDATTIDAGASKNRFSGGQYKNIVDNGSGTILENLDYLSSGGGITGSGTRRSKRNVYDFTALVFASDLKPGSLESTTTVLTATATVVLTLPSTGNGMFVVQAYIAGGTGSAALYGAYALVYQDNASAVILHQVNGSSLSITLVGQTIKVTQISGATLPVYCSASIL